MGDINGTEASHPDPLPRAKLEFALLDGAATTLQPRRGRLALPARKPLLTPAFFANTSRGVVPHVSPDNFRRLMDAGGVYVALEDCGFAP